MASHAGAEHPKVDETRLPVYDNVVAAQTDEEPHPISLQVKPFGKDGVRLCWLYPMLETQTGATAITRGNIVAEMAIETEWVTVGESAEAETDSGVIAVRASPSIPACPRNALWRVRCGIITSKTEALQRVPGTNRAQQSRRRARMEKLLDDDTERVYNILQWYGTVVIDMRQAANDVVRITESLACPNASDLAALPFRDDALVIGELPSTSLDILHGRVHKCIFSIGAAVVGMLLLDFPFLCGDPAAKRRVLPNIVGTRLAIGHQGHALHLSDWARDLNIVGVVNLAPNKVPSILEAIKDKSHYFEVWHEDGEPLWDNIGDGGRLLDVLPTTLHAIDEALKVSIKGRVFIHCQQGRSRAASIATAHLLMKNSSWNLFDAVAFLSLRRPETELNMSYAESLEKFAVSQDRPESLQRLCLELPSHVRCGGVARDVRDKCLDLSHRL